MKFYEYSTITSKHYRYEAEHHQEIAVEHYESSKMDLPSEEDIFDARFYAAHHYAIARVKLGIKEADYNFA